MCTLFLLFVVGNILFVPIFAQNITNHSQPFIILDGEQTVIRCHPVNVNATIIKWEIFGKIVGDLMSDDDSLSNFNISRNSTLMVNNPRGYSLQGLVNVTCIAYSNNRTNLSLERILYQVILYKAPKITNNKMTYDVPDDGSNSTTISCNVNGFPPPDIKWMFYNDTLVAGQPYFINTSDIANANLTASNDGKLEVTSKQRRGGFGLKVNCTANNTDGDARRRFLVRFLKAPQILTEVQHKIIPEKSGQHPSFPCRAIGYPRPAINWLFGNVTLNSSSGIHLGDYVFDVEQLRRVYVSFEVSDNGTLLIRNAVYKQHLPFNNFTCVASSTLGEDRMTSTLAIGELKSYKFDIHLFNISQVGGQANNVLTKIYGAFIDGFSLYSIKVNITNTTLGTLTIDLAWFTEDLKNYKIGDKFNTAAIARDVLQRLENNNIFVSFFRMNAKPGPATDLSIDDVTSSAISFSWKHPKYFVVTGYQIQFKDGGSDWKNWKMISGSATSVEVDSLDEDTKYLFRMESINGYGTGIPSEVIEGGTEGTLSPVIIAVVVVLVVLVAIAIVLGVMYYRRRPKADDNIILGEINPYEFSMPGIAPSNIYVRGNTTVIEMETYDISNEGAEKECYSWREITRESLTMGDTLGQGEFGMVVKALWADDETKTHVPVAVKTIKENATETDRKELFKELRLMAEISEHANVVNLIGACSNGGPLWIIVELCEHGNLLIFLRKNREEIPSRPGDFNSSLDPLVRVRIAYDVSKGMHYLEEKKIVHRDLAARNVLLGKNKVAKIADFGLSRDIYEVGLYQKNTGGKLPVKWMAIESLEDATYTSKSDVWSFGVLYWEIESAGLVPYPGIGGRDILGYLLNGFRLDRPSETPFEIYEIMKKCWEPSPKVRPSFAEIESELEAYLEVRSDYLPVLIEEEPADDQAYLNYFVDLEDETTSL